VSRRERIRTAEWNWLGLTWGDVVMVALERGRGQEGGGKGNEPSKQPEIRDVHFVERRVEDGEPDC